MLKDHSTGKVEGHCFEETHALLVLRKARAGGGVLHLSSGMVASNSTRAQPRSLGFCSLAFKCHGQVQSALTIQDRDGVSSVCVQLTSHANLQRFRDLFFGHLSHATFSPMLLQNNGPYHTVESSVKLFGLRLSALA